MTYKIGLESIGEIEEGQLNDPFYSNIFRIFPGFDYDLLVGSNYIRIVEVELVFKLKEIKNFICGINDDENYNENCNDIRYYIKKEANGCWGYFREFSVRCHGYDTRSWLVIWGETKEVIDKYTKKAVEWYKKQDKVDLAIQKFKFRRFVRPGD